MDRSITSVANENGQDADGGSERPDVSVVIPAYNAAETIAYALGSFAAQDGVSFETIVVDDGSQDGTTKVVSDVARLARPDSVRLLRHPDAGNRGVAASRNLGLARARAPFVAFLDADDWLLPGSLRARAEALRKHGDVALVYGRVRSTSSETSVGGFVGRGVAERPISLSRWLLFENPIPTSTVMLRRDAVPGPLFPEGLHHQMEDWAAWLTLSQRWQALFLDRELAVYRQTPSSWSTRLGDRWVRHAQLREEADLLRRFSEGPLITSKTAVNDALAYRSGRLCVEALGQFGRLRLGVGKKCLASAMAIAGSKRVLARAMCLWAPRLKLRSWFGKAPEAGPAWASFIAS